jgi:hypothetical protein
VKYWEIIADNLKKAGWSWGCVSAIDSNGRTFWIADAHRSDGKRFIVRADEKLTAFLDRTATITGGRLLLDQANWLSARPASKVFSAATNSSNQKSNER